MVGIIIVQCICTCTCNKKCCVSLKACVVACYALLVPGLKCMCSLECVHSFGFGLLYNMLPQ